MVATTPLVLKARLNTRAVLRRLEDLSTDERSLADELIHLLGQHNRTNFGQNLDTDRESFWRLVFRNWDTRYPVIKPGPITPRTSAQGALQLGYLSQDCPEPLKGGKKRSREGVYLVPAHRKHLQGVLLEVNLDHDNQGVAFKWTDTRHRPVPGKLVQLNPGLSRPQAWAEVILHRDTEESIRVGRWNESMVVYWGRQRLMHHLEKEAARDAEADGINNTADIQRPATAINPDEDLGQLLPLELASDYLTTYTQAIAELGAMNASRPAQVYDHRNGSI